MVEWFLHSAGMRFVPVLFFVLLCNSIVLPQKSYFYSGKQYGSESLFNPLSLILNGSFDIIQLENFTRKPGNLAFQNGIRNVNKNLLSPLNSISRYGWANFLKTEVLPIEFKKKNAQWWPNYQLHLIGGGMSYAAMAEWYQIKGANYPKVLSGITIFTYHYLNEVIENDSYSGVNVDPIADVYLFDLGGCILFSSERVKEFFAETLHLRDWSLQPSITPNTGELHNNGQYFSMKWFPVSSSSYGLFYYYGINGITGITKKLYSTQSISIGGGLRAKKHQNIRGEVNHKTVETVWTAGLFWDREGSLLGSIFFSGLSDYFINVNVYPGVIETGFGNIGIWAAANRNGNLVWGLNFLHLPGIGASSLPVD